jgi:Ca2+-binding RTX toxin-like protein
MADRFVVDLANGAFAPGVTPEPGGLPEIEIDVDLNGPGNQDQFEVWGSAGNDDIAGGRLGADLAVALNADNDADITVDGPLNRVRLYGLAGNDTIGVGGVQLGIAPWAGNTELYGGAGGDFLYGGDGRDVLRGDAGVDSFSAGAGADRLFALDGNAENVATGPGADWVQVDATDVVS